MYFWSERYILVHVDLIQASMIYVVYKECALLNCEKGKRVIRCGMQMHDVKMIRKVW